MKLTNQARRLRRPLLLFCSIKSPGDVILRTYDQKLHRSKGTGPRQGTYALSAVSSFPLLMLVEDLVVSLTAIGLDYIADAEFAIANAQFTLSVLRDFVDIVLKFLR